MSTVLEWEGSCRICWWYGGHHPDCPEGECAVPEPSPRRLAQALCKHGCLPGTAIDLSLRAHRVTFPALRLALLRASTGLSEQHAMHALESAGYIVHR